MVPTVPVVSVVSSLVTVLIGMTTTGDVAVEISAVVEGGSVGPHGKVPSGHLCVLHTWRAIVFCLSQIILGCPMILMFAFWPIKVKHDRYLVFRPQSPQDALHGDQGDHLPKTPSTSQPPRDRQARTCSATPWHGAPPCAGVGLLHKRLRS